MWIQSFKWFCCHWLATKIIIDVMVAQDSWISKWEQLQDISLGAQELNIGLSKFNNSLHEVLYMIKDKKKIINAKTLKDIKKWKKQEFFLHQWWIIDNLTIHES